VRQQKHLPPKLLLAKLLAARDDAAYNGYASTRKVKIPEKERTVLHCSNRLATSDTFVLPLNTVLDGAEIRCGSFPKQDRVREILLLIGVDLMQVLLMIDAT
jgi:hypothetical protein